MDLFYKAQLAPSLPALVDAVNAIFVFDGIEPPAWVADGVPDHLKGPQPSSSVATVLVKPGPAAGKRAAVAAASTQLNPTAARASAAAPAAGFVCGGALYAGAPRADPAARAAAPAPAALAPAAPAPAAPPPAAPAPAAPPPAAPAPAKKQQLSLLLGLNGDIVWPADMTMGAIKAAADATGRLSTSLYDRNIYHWCALLGAHRGDGARSTAAVESFWSSVQKVSAVCARWVVGAGAVKQWLAGRGGRGDSLGLHRLLTPLLTCRRTA